MGKSDKRYDDARASDPNRRMAKRNARLVREYGITLADYAVMLDFQHGRCAICGDFPAHDKVLHVDHCHLTGKVRGLLCPNCNHALGKLQDDPVKLRRAADYLETHV